MNTLLRILASATQDRSGEGAGIASRAIIAILGTVQCSICVDNTIIQVDGRPNVVGLVVTLTVRRELGATQAGGRGVASVSEATQFIGSRTR